MKYSYLVGCVLATISLTPRDIYACGCAFGVLESAPGEGAVIPTNASLYVLYADIPQEDGHLTVMSSGQELPLIYADTKNGSTNSRWGTPAAELPPDTDLQWELWQGPLLTFSTGSAADHVAPSGGNTITDAVGFYDKGSSSSCGGTVGVRVQLDPATDDSPVLYEVQIAHDNVFEQAVSTILSTTSRVVVGQEVIDACVANYYELDAGDTVWVRGRSVDIAGNTNVWSDATEITVPTCSMAANTSSGFTWAALALLGLRASRRRLPHRR